MKHMRIQKQFFTLVILIAINISVSAQSYSDGDLTIWITGGSTLHDWKVKAEEVKDFPSSLEVTSQEQFDINGFSFAVVVKSMDGGRGPSMNNKIYKALMADTHPEILFRQKSSAQFSLSESEGGWSASIEGTVNMVGQEREIEVVAKGEAQENSIIFTGAIPLKLSDFDIEPPSAMFGQIQTKDDIVVHFELEYQKS